MSWVGSFTAPLAASRRALRMAVGCLALLAVAFAAFPAHAGPKKLRPLPVLKPVDLSKLDLAAFADEDLDLPYYLAHLHEVANSIVSSGPTRGFIGIHVWQSHADPRDARVMENVLSLAWFYTQDRSWNPYRGDAALRARLEAALDFLSAVFTPEGRSEPASLRSLPPVGFTAKFLGETLILLRSGPPIDADVYARALRTQRRVVEVGLTSQRLVRHGRRYSNQYTNLWGGGLAYLALDKDAELERLWQRRFRDGRDELQSPAGYYYEKDGPDFAYGLDTHGASVHQAWEWLRGTALGDELLARERSFFDWLSRNALPEPSDDGFVLNAAIATRRRRPFVDRDTTPLAEFIQVARAFAEAREELKTRRARQRAALAAHWPRVEPLRIGQRNGYSPYAFLNRRSSPWRPTTRERRAALRALAPLARARFNEVRRDARKDIRYAFVKRPRYYAAFTGGELATEPQRYGLGLLWNPRLGAFLQSQWASNDAAWGTRAAAAARVYESESIPVSFVMNGTPLDAPAPGVTELPAGELEARYALGKLGEKSVLFSEAAIEVSVRHAGDFDETLPLLVPADARLARTAGRLTLASARGTIAVEFDRSVRTSYAETATTVLSKRLVVLTLHATSELRYSIGAR